MLFMTDRNHDRNHSYTEIDGDVNQESKKVLNSADEPFNLTQLQLFPISAEPSVATSIAYGPILTKVIDNLAAAFDIKKEVCKHLP